MAGRATQERTLGAILGMAIGDALGMPVIGRTRAEIAADLGPIEGYHGRTFPDGAELAPGEFTDETEIALCIMETYTSANGFLDPDLIRARMQFLARGESRRWMSPETLRSLDDGGDPWYCASASDDPEVPMRGIPIGLVHAAPVLDEAALARDLETVVSLTHCNRSALQQSRLVAEAVARVLAGSSSRETLIPDLLRTVQDEQLSQALQRMQAGIEAGSSLDALAQDVETGNPAIDVLTSGLAAFILGDRFEDAVFAAASLGGPADARAAFTGALAGAHAGAGGIPQTLIDNLEGRIYLTLAAPWFYRTIQLMTGRGIAMTPNGH